MGDLLGSHVFIGPWWVKLSLVAVRCRFTGTNEWMLMGWWILSNGSPTRRIWREKMILLQLKSDEERISEACSGRASLWLDRFFLESSYRTQTTTRHLEYRNESPKKFKKKDQPSFLILIGPNRVNQHTHTQSPSSMGGGNPIIRRITEANFGPINYDCDLMISSRQLRRQRVGGMRRHRTAAAAAPESTPADV